MANDENDEILRSTENSCDITTNFNNSRESATPSSISVASPSQSSSVVENYDNNEQASSTTNTKSSGKIDSCDSHNIFERPADIVDSCQTTNVDTGSNLDEIQSQQRHQTTSGTQQLPAYGDYKNIRATGGFTADSTADLLQSHAASIPSHHPVPQNPFSFKHFLNRDTTSSSVAPSSSAAIITSINSNLANSTTAATADASQCTHSKHELAASNSSATLVAATSSPPVASLSSPLLATSYYQTSTGARPKVPQLASISVTSTSTSSFSLIGGARGTGAAAAVTDGVVAVDSATSSKMKRSPRFSSFDSQASLAEYAAAAAVTGSGSSAAGGSGSTSLNAGFRRFAEPADLTLRASDRDDYFTRVEGRNQLPTTSTAGSTSSANEYERQFVPRSYSHYDMQIPPSPRRRAGVDGCSNSDVRPNRLSGLQPQGAKLKGTLFSSVTNSSGREQPLDSYNLGELSTKPTSSQASGVASCSSNRLLPNSEFPNSAAASALPDFVQDHLMDSWYSNDMNLSSPPNSPIDFVEDLPTGCGGGASVSHCNASSSSTGDKCQTLPDFLSDGPIIHSSQRLADVAAGLPSNLDSPEDNSLSLQLSRLRLENERLCRELNETRVALGEQTRRFNELERSLEETHKMEAAYNRNLAKNIGVVEENLDQSKKRTAAAQNHVAKLKQQVKHLTAEVESLKRENDSLREDGAVGGSSDRPSSSAGAGICGAAGGGGVSSSCGISGASGPSTRRPSRSQHLSRELLRAASNAENNLRQLLAGVDNLRQMAAGIENSERLDYDDSPDLFSEFLDDCDDYDEYTGGPAL